MKSAKCPWCGRNITLSHKGAFTPHIQAPKVMCVGGGMNPVIQHESVPKPKAMVPKPKAIRKGGRRAR